MERKKLVFLNGTMIMLLLVSFAIYSQIKPEDNEYITHAEFVNILIRVLELEDQLPAAATLTDKVRLLEELGYAPLGGWELERILTKGDVAAVLARILGINAPLDASPEDYIQALANQGIMSPGSAALPFSLEDLTASVNTAAEMPGARAGSDIPPYRLPVTPTN